MKNENKMETKQLSNEICQKVSVWSFSFFPNGPHPPCLMFVFKISRNFILKFRKFNFKNNNNSNNNNNNGNRLFKSVFYAHYATDDTR